MNIALTTIARFTLIDALRSRWLWLAAASGVLTLALATFAGSMALTERGSVMLATAAPIARLQAVLLMAMLTIASVVREIQERSLLLMLAAPISRSQWLFGKLAGWVLLAWLTALIAALPLALLQLSPALLVWTLSLACELSLTSAAALLFALILRQVAAAVLATLGFYAAARLIGVILLINERAPLELGAADWLSSAVLKMVAAVLPRFDLYTQTDWLLTSIQPTVGYSLPEMTTAMAANAVSLAPVMLQTLLFAALLLTVAALDLRRSEL